MDDCDLVVIGAGPAGLAAAVRAAGLGLSVVVLDEQPRAGGQVWRDVGQLDPARAEALGRDYTAGRPLVDALRASGARHLTGAVVWRIEPSGQVTFSQDGRAQLVRGRRLLLATGAMERPMPVPGWTLPGVLTAGAGQILLKSSGLVPERAVLAGSGPLLYLLAVQMLRAGVPPLALVETQTATDFAQALRHAPRALIGSKMLAKGAAMLSALRRAGVPRYRGATGLECVGVSRVEALRLVHAGRPVEIGCDTVLLHHGVIPNTQVSRSLELPHVWDKRQHAFRPTCDPWGRTALPTVFVAGDGAGIAGAQAAVLAGEIAALAIASDLGALPEGERDLAGRSLRARLSVERAARPFLDAAFPPFRQALAPADDTIICRCEEVTAGDIRRFAGLGCKGPNQAKAFGRVGMGPCQGRVCGPSVTGLLAQAHGQPPEVIGSFRVRAPLKPVTLGELAALAP